MCLEALEDRSLLSNLPYGATWYDTSEYMIGTVYVSVVLFESNGTIDSESEDWTPEELLLVQAQIENGADWWVDMFNKYTDGQSLEFRINWSNLYAPIPTGYEPIRHVHTDEHLWINKFLDHVNYLTRPSEDYYFEDDLTRWNNHQRTIHETDWAYTVFVVDSSNDSDGAFADPRYAAYAYLGGPSVTMTYDVGDQLLGVYSMNETFAHETGHIFYALDEYGGDGDSYYAHSGYYNTQNLNARVDNPDDWFWLNQHPSIMAGNEVWFPFETWAYLNQTSSPTSLRMIGWRDSDGDGISDVVDVPLTLTGSGSYSYITGIFEFTGHSSVQTYSNANPNTGIWIWSPAIGQWVRSHPSDITINKVDQIYYQLDGGPWVAGNSYGVSAKNVPVSQDVAVTNPGWHTITFRTESHSPHVLSNEMTYTFLVNPPPEVEAGPDVALVEGVALGRTVSITDPGDTGWTALVDYGDGSDPVVYQLPGQTTFALYHVFPDNGVYPVTVTVTDSIGQTGTDSFFVTVTNVAPTARVEGPSGGVRGQPRRFTLTADDPAAADRAAGFTYSIDWGDGSPIEVVPRTPGNGAGVVVERAYVASGTYTVQVTATDKDLGQDPAAPHTLIIRAVEMQGDTLAVGGTLGHDQLIFQPVGINGVSVLLNGANQGSFPGVHRLLAFGQAGNDVIVVSASSLAEIHGGAGNDIITSGAGHDVIWGDAGNDTLLGLGGNDVLVGGAGQDILLGGFGDDLLFGGEMRGGLAHNDTEEYNYATLRAIGDAWAAGMIDSDLDTSLADDIDDTETDTLVGGMGKDWFFGNSSGGIFDIFADFIPLQDKKKWL